MIFLYAFLAIILVVAILLFCPVFVHISFKEKKLHKQQDTNI